MDFEQILLCNSSLNAILRSQKFSDLRLQTSLAQPWPYLQLTPLNGFRSGAMR